MINAESLLRDIEKVEIIRPEWDGDLLTLTDEQKDAAVRHVVKNFPEYHNELLPGEECYGLNASKLIKMLYWDNDPAAFTSEIVRLHKEYSEDELINSLQSEATIGRNIELYNMIKTDPFGFAAEIADNIYLYLESEIRECLFSSVRKAANDSY